jgi:TolB-like protein/Tfp pilus assembly protein PilF
MSTDAENEFFSDGMTEELLNVLTKLGRFRVPARTSSFAYKGKDMDVREIGRQLGVEAVLEGSVRKSGDRVRITSQLINVDNGYHLWSESYDREIKDIFAIQDEIALCIAEALNVRLTEREVSTIRKVPTQSVRAYEYYLQGRQLIYKFRRRSFAHARDFFARAIEIDPSYALAYTGIADCCSFLYMYWEHTEENLAEADRASLTALDHDPELAEAHAARGLALSLSKKYGEAEHELERAIELDPMLYEAYYFYARACWAQGKLDRAEKLFRDANRVRPEDYQSLILLSNVYEAQGRPEDQRATGERALKIIRHHLELYPDDVRAHYLGAGALIINGKLAEGRAWLEQSLETDDPSVYYNVACGFMQLGEPERALDCLSRAVDAGFAHREWAANDPELAPLKGDPRFEAILNRMS